MPFAVNFGIFSVFPSASLVTAPARRGLLAGVLRLHIGLPAPRRATQRESCRPCSLPKECHSLCSAGRGLPARASIPSTAAEIPLAIKGYYPVAYFTDGKPTPGSPQFEFERDEHRYRFASAEHRDLFKADPVHYAPAIRRFRAMALALNQVVVAGPENWLISDGKSTSLAKLPHWPELFQKKFRQQYRQSKPEPFDPSEE